MKQTYDVRVHELTFETDDKGKSHLVSKVIKGDYSGEVTGTSEQAVVQAVRMKIILTEGTDLSGETEVDAISTAMDNFDKKYVVSAALVDSYNVKAAAKADSFSSGIALH